MANNSTGVHHKPLTWLDSRGARVCLIILYAILVLTPVLLALVIDPRAASPLYELGRAAALTGFAILAFQVALGSRLGFTDRAFGLDRVMRFHKTTAIVAGVLILAHPILLSLGTGSTHLFSFDTSWQINLGKLGLLFLVGTILFAVAVPVLRFDYQIWRLFHKGALLILIIGFIHSWLVGGDLQHTGMKVYWSALLAVALGSFAYRNIFVPLRGKNRFNVRSVEPATYNTWTLTFDPGTNRLFRYRPGQFMFLTLLRKGRRTEEHPFTISSSPTQHGLITATIKESGDFTRTIGETKPGDTALVQAPFGRYSFLHHEPKRFLFIAGGVGITPIRSMLRYLRDTGDGRPATVIYANRTERDIIFRDELDTMPEHMNIVHVLSDPAPDWQGERGYVTEEIIKRHAGDTLAEAHVYLCGPPPMMTMVIRILRSMGVHPSRIHYERFAL
jgi:predicted ferric reductase